MFKPIWIRILIWCFVPFIIFIIVFETPLLNKRFQKNKAVKLIDGSFINVFSKHSEVNYIGNALIFDIEIGVNQPTIYNWQRNGKDFQFKTFLKPVVFAEEGSDFYLVISDHIGLNRGYIEFHFYCNDGKGWVEIPYKQFPKNLAVQNFNIFQMYYPFKLDPNKDFQHSLTGQLWALLETGKNIVLESKTTFYEDYAIRYNITEEMFSDPNDK